MNVWIGTKGFGIGGVTTDGTIWGMSGDWFTLGALVIFCAAAWAEKRRFG